MKREHLFITLLFLLSLSFIILLPIKYAGTGFFNPILSDEIYFAETRSELVFGIIKNIFYTGSIRLNQSYFNQNLDENVDIGYSYGFYYPLERQYTYLFFGPPGYLGFYLGNDALAYKLMLFSNMVYFSAAIVIFYLIMRRFGFKTGLAALASMAFGFGTGMLIYPRTLMSQTIEIMLILLVYLFYLSKKKEVSLGFMGILFLGGPRYVLLFLPLYFLDRDREHLKRTLIVASAILLFTSAFSVDIQVTHWVGALFLEFPGVMQGSMVEYDPFFNGISKNSLFYSFENIGGLFLNSYPIFGSLFSERGFVYNSPFLIFSIFGLIAMKKNRRNFLLAVFLVNLFGVFWLTVWTGGYTPRYVRLFFPAIAALTIASFDWFSREKNKCLKVIFLLLLFISVVNVFGLSIRFDWLYSRPENSLGYGYVLSPFYSTLYGNYPPMEIDWNFGGSGDCLPFFREGYLVLDPCDCAYESFAWAKIFLEESAVLGCIICADYSGGDGTIALLEINSNKEEIFVGSKQCINLERYLTSGNNTIRVTSGMHGFCDGEYSKWAFYLI